MLHICLTNSIPTTYKQNITNRSTNANTTNKLLVLHTKRSTFPHLHPGWLCVVWSVFTFQPDYNTHVSMQNVTNRWNGINKEFVFITLRFGSFRLLTNQSRKDLKVYWKRCRRFYVALKKNDLVQKSLPHAKSQFKINMKVEMIKMFLLKSATTSAFHLMTSATKLIVE